MANTKIRGAFPFPGALAAVAASDWRAANSSQPTATSQFAVSLRMMNPLQLLLMRLPVGLDIKFQPLGLDHP